MKKYGDMEILQTVGEHVMITIHQATELLFPSAQMARRRLRRMGKKGLLARSAGVFLGKRGRPENLVCLGAEGKQQLKLATGVDFSPERTRLVDHQLFINWFRLYLRRLENPSLAAPFLSAASPFAVDAAGNSILRNVLPTNPDQLVFIPDGAFVLTDKTRPKSLLFFLEADLGTEVLVNGKRNDLRQKIVNYRNYLGLKCYRRYETIFHASFQGFRVLFLTHTLARRQQLCRLVRELAPADFVWIADQAAMFAEGLGSQIWSPGGRDTEPSRSILGSLAFPQG